MSYKKERSLSSVARNVGVSPAAVSLVKAGKYNGAPETAARIEVALQELDEKTAPVVVDHTPEPSEREEALPADSAHQYTHFQTQSQRVLQAVLTATTEDREFSLAIGPSGIGKTHAAREFLARLPKSTYLEVPKRAISLAGLTGLICEKWQLRSSGSVEQKLGRLISYARDGGCSLLVIDEADLFVDPRRPSSFLDRLEICRKLADAGLPLVLIGLPALEEAIRETRESYIWSRLGYYAPLTAPHPDELHTFANRLGLQDPRVVAAANQRGYFRLINKVHIRATRVGEANALALVYLAEGGR